MLGKTGKATKADEADSTLECHFESYVGALVVQARNVDGGEGGDQTGAVYTWYQNLLAPHLDEAMGKALVEVTIETNHKAVKKRKVTK